MKLDVKSATYTKNVNYNVSIYTAMAPVVPPSQNLSCEGINTYVFYDL